MTRSKFFVASWDGADKAGSFVVELYGEGVGEVVTKLTKAARKTALPDGMKLRVNIPLERPREATELRALDDYRWATGDLNARRFQRHLGATARDGRLHLFEPRNIVASGPDLVGREALIDELLKTLERGSCHLRAPRRYGKTSVLRRLSEILPAALRIDVGEETLVESFALVIVDAALRSSPGDEVLRSLPRFADWPEPGAAFEAWQEARERLAEQTRGRAPALLDEVLSALSEAGIVLLIDEFSLYLRNLVRRDRTQGQQLLRAFGALRTRSKHPLRCVLAGSTGLSAFMQYHGLQAELEDLRPVDLGPLADEVARELVEELLYGPTHRPNPAAIDRFLEHLGRPIPYFIHALAVELTDRARARRDGGKRAAITPDDVDRAYYDGLLSVTGGDTFKPFRVEERPYPDRSKPVARRVLAALAQSEAPVPTDTLMARAGLDDSEESRTEIETLLTCLEEDYDLERSDAGWSMRSKVLADRLGRATRPRE